MFPFTPSKAKGDLLGACDFNLTTFKNKIFHNRLTSTPFINFTNLPKPWSLEHKFTHFLMAVR
jgi:hypothetical protein